VDLTLETGTTVQLPPPHPPGWPIRCALLVAGCQASSTEQSAGNAAASGRHPTTPWAADIALRTSLPASSSMPGCRAAAPVESRIRHGRVCCRGGGSRWLAPAAAAFLVTMQVLQLAAAGGASSYPNGMGAPGAGSTVNREGSGGSGGLPPSAPALNSVQAPGDAAAADAAPYRVNTLSLT